MIWCYLQHTDWPRMLRNIGLHTQIKINAWFDPEGQIIIGDHCMISAEVRIYAHTHHFNKRNWMELDHITKTTVIEDHVFIGARATILPGVHIAEGVVIGIGSVVTKNIEEPYTIWAGNPARQIGVVDDDKETVSHAGTCESRSPG